MEGDLIIWEPGKPEGNFLRLRDSLEVPGLSLSLGSGLVGLSGLSGSKHRFHGNPSRLALLPGTSMYLPELNPIRVEEFLSHLRWSSVTSISTGEALAGTTSAKTGSAHCLREKRCGNARRLAQSLPANARKPRLLRTPPSYVLPRERESYAKASKVPEGNSSSLPFRWHASAIGSSSPFRRHLNRNSRKRRGQAREFRSQTPHQHFRKQPSKRPFLTEPPSWCILQAISIYNHIILPRGPNHNTSPGLFEPKPRRAMPYRVLNIQVRS